MSGTKKWAEIKRERQANILDPIHAELDPRVWDQAASEKPVLKTQHAHWIKSKIYETLANAGYTDIQDWLTLVFTGSLTTYQYSEDSDADISLFVDTRVFPEWSRAEMIALLVHKLDGTTLPGTPFPLQDFVVGEGIKPSDLYKPGLRSGYNIDNGKWIVPPEKSRVHDVKSEQGGFYAWALQMADKMERLLRYEPDAAVQFWHQIHKKRQRDMKAGKGDYTESNAVYKMLANRGLFPQISGVSGEYIAKTAAIQMPKWDPEEHGCLSVAEKVNELNPHLRYVEGWTRLSPDEEWGNHAWNETSKGEVVDPHGKHFWPEGLEYRRAQPGDEPFEYDPHEEIPGYIAKTSMAADPDFIRRWIEEKGPYLYHGAHSREGVHPDVVAEKIEREGILPDMRGGPDYESYPEATEDERAKGEYDWENPERHRELDHELEERWLHPRPGHVFMTTRPDYAYGGPHGHGGALFRVDLRKLDPANLNPDDDWLRELNAQTHKFLVPPMTLGDEAEARDWGSDPGDTAASFRTHGTVAHRGPIPPEAIERIDNLAKTVAPHTLYHHTYPEHVESIEREGLHPRYDIAARETESVPSVYLTSNPKSHLPVSFAVNVEGLPIEDDMSRDPHDPEMEDSDASWHSTTTPILPDRIKRIAKTSAVMYHVAPQSLRAIIDEQGLVPQSSEGLYFSPEMDNAMQRFQSYNRYDRRKPFDLYEADVTGIEPKWVLREGNHHVFDQIIPPERIKRIAKTSARLPGDRDYWSGGGCAAYAQSLLEDHPELHLGIRGWQEDDGGWTPDHFFAHDDAYAYDSQGKWPLESLERPGYEIKLNENPEDWEEVGGADEREVQKARQHRQKHIAKTSAAPQVMYHATPWYNREAIERNGLEGEVYLSPHPSAAEEYNRSGQNDLWAVDVAGLQPHSTGDEFGEMPEYTVPGVGAERLMLHTPASHPRHNAEYGPMQPHHERILGLAKTAALTWDGVDLTALREQGRAITNAETPESRAYMHDYGCHNIAPLVADATGGYHASGLYLDPEEPIDHHWVVKDGHIIDATYDSILPPGHPEQRRYVEYDDMPEETDPLEHPENFDRWQKEYIAKTAANDWFAPSYMVPDHIKQQLHEWRQGLPWSEGSNLSPYDRFHVTGLYSPTGFSNPEHQAWVQSRSGLTYPVQTIGVESFGAGAKGHPVVLRVHHPQLQEDTERLQDEAEQHGIEVSRHPEGYKPHITLGYSPEPVEGDHPHMTFPVGPLKDLHTYYDESKRAAKTSSAPVKPPNYRHQDKPSEKCGNCKMNNKGHCWGYGNVEIEHDDVCDSWAPETKTAAFNPGQYDLEPYRADEECHDCAYGVAQAYPDLVQESGFYVHPKRGPGDHSWNVAPDETIVDTTSSQHPGPEIVPLGHPHYKRYVSYERAFPQAAQIAHERGEHDYYKDSGGIAECPLCKRTAKTASYPTGFQTMFHVSPRKNRESILEHGLKGHEGEHESPWEYTWDQPRGNYLFDNLDDARMYVHGLRQRQHGENRHEYDEERQFEPPEPPPGSEDWPVEKMDQWIQDWYDNPVPSNDDPLGYDIYSVQAHGLPLGQDPESASVAQKRSEDPNLYGDKNPHWDIGRIHDEYERQAEPLMRDGEIGYPDLDELHNEVGSYHGAEPKRYYVPTAIKPSRLALEEHHPLWDVTPESEEALYEDTAPQEVPSPWMQVPFTERPMPGHESKIATRVLYNGFRPDPVHPKGAGSEPTLPFIYDPAEDLVHLGPANSYHHQLIERTPELRAQYGEVGRWTQPPSQSEEGKAHVHGNMEWPSKRVQFQSEVNEDQERAIRQALKAPEPEDVEDPEWGFQSKTAASHLAQKVYAETIAKDGSTYDLQGKPPTTRFGYAPSLHTQTPVHPDQLSPDVIDDFIAAHKDELEEPGKYIGTWLHDGNYVLDVTEGHDDYDTAFERAWNGHQKAMWDGLKNEEIPVRGLDYQQPLAFA